MNKALLVAVASLAPLGAAGAQQPSLATSLGLFVYPGEGQSPETQNADEADCYRWAQQTTGIDPINAPQTPPAPPPQTAGGAGRRALRGAAGAALIADIADADTSEAAWAGAVVGGSRGARERQVRNEASQQAAQAEADAKAQELRSTFNRGFAACLEGKRYTVK